MRIKGLDWTEQMRVHDLPKVVTRTDFPRLKVEPSGDPFQRLREALHSCSHRHDTLGWHDELIMLYISDSIDNSHDVIAIE